MTRDKRKVEAALRRKGFQADDTHHHRFFHYAADGRATGIRTHTSHSRRHRTLGDDLLNAMARQCRISKADFLQLVDCELTGEAYEQMVTCSPE
ncbi:MAG: type II toxin-antitoxin system HicA family toxin [Gammaproteobacteria bacterium]|nr:type II toxin-antitoxin system HicA family toxin [Gammaproteobacteria bacterium]MDE0178008.1 type II toxin-antitoxin system HicA family toxin [Gammaproteobacteria bacterium]MDE0444655.1 type II toxin-antitoxin system HicA family toxin [Gammaproteobacteria bacterium]